MTQDEIIRMAREAGFETIDGKLFLVGYDGEFSVELLERFATLVAAHEREQVLANDDSLTLAYMVGSREGRLAEREACAKVCEERVSISRDVLAKSTAGLCAAAIRARGNNK